MFHWLTIFLIVAATDVVWAKYTAAIAQKRKFAASWSAVLIIVFGGFTMTSYVQDIWLLIPAGAGAFFGTWITVRKS